MPAPESDHVLTLLTDANPIDVENLLSTEEVDHAWARLDRKLAGVASEGSPVGGVRRRRRISRLARSRRAVAVAIAVAAAAAAGVVAIPGAGPETGGLLDAAAAIAAEQPTPNPGPGQYYHEEWRSWARTDILKSDRNGLGVLDFQWYVRPDGSGMATTSNRLLHGIRHPRTVTQWNVAGPASPPIKTVTRISDRALVSETDFGPGQFNTVAFTAADPFQPDHLSELPVDPPALKRWLEQRLVTHPPHFGASVWDGGPEAEALLPEIADLLRNPTSSSQLRSALFTVAGEIPGVTVQQNVKDVDGDTGEAIITSADAGKYQHTWRDPITGTTHTQIDTGTGEGRTFELILDPNTTHILATEYLDKGQVIEYTVNVSQGVVNSVR
jgi:hypothetical protein